MRESGREELAVRHRSTVQPRRSRTENMSADVPEKGASVMRQMGADEAQYRSAQEL